MPLPAQNIPTPEAARTYVNQYIVPNGMNLINGSEMNNVLNALITFIEQSPLNWQKALIWSTGGNYVATQPTIIFTSVTPSSLQWGSNIYNEYLFINTTSQNIPLASGFFYYDISLNAISYIPAQERLRVVQAINGQWIQAADFGNVIPPANISFGLLNFVVGEGSPVIMVNGQTVLTINQSSVFLNNVSIFVDGPIVYPNISTQFSYSIVYNADDVVITFNQGVSDGQNIIVNYAYST